MMTFILLTLSFVVANLLTIGIIVALSMNEKVMNWYMNYVLKSMGDFTNLMEEQLKDEL